MTGNRRRRPGTTSERGLFPSPPARGCRGTAGCAARCRAAAALPSRPHQPPPRLHDPSRSPRTPGRLRAGWRSLRCSPSPAGGLRTTRAPLPPPPGRRGPRSGASPPPRCAHLGDAAARGAIAGLGGEGRPCPPPPCAPAACQRLRVPAHPRSLPGTSRLPQPQTAGSPPGPARPDPPCPLTPALLPLPPGAATRRTPTHGHCAGQAESPDPRTVVAPGCGSDPGGALRRGQGQTSPSTEASLPELGDAGLPLGVGHLPLSTSSCAPRNPTRFPPGFTKLEDTERSKNASPDPLCLLQSLP